MDFFSYKRALLLAALMSFPFSLLMILTYFYNQAPLVNTNIVVPTYVAVSNFMIFYLTYITDLAIIKLKKRPSAKYFIWTFGTITITFVLSSIFSKLMHLVNPDSILESNSAMKYLIKDLIIVVVAHISTMFIYITRKEKEAAIDQERLVAENIRIRYEILKSQVDPHFVFNSLNTLDGLIGINDDDAHKYLQNLSSVFRYVINNKEIIQLSDELSFTESYASMMKIRHGDGFRIEYHVDEKYKTWFIMPISLQLLVENAIKHNVVSKSSPLLVTIETTPGDTIRVKNSLNLKKEPERGEGIGLANLADRYILLLHKDIIITQTDVFCVEIPLVKQPLSNRTHNL